MKKLLILLMLMFPAVAWAVDISTISDNFDDNSINTSLWDETELNATISEVNQQIEIVTDESFYADYGLLFTDNSYTINDSETFIEFVQYGGEDSPGLSLVDASFTIYIQFFIVADDIYAYIYDEGETIDDFYSDTYNSTNHRWVKIKESNGTIYWYVSSDGITWNSFWSYVYEVGSTEFYVQTGSYGYSGIESTSILDNFNVEPEAPTVDKVWNNAYLNDVYM